MKLKINVTRLYRGFSVTVLAAMAVSGWLLELSAFATFALLPAVMLISAAALIALDDAMFGENDEECECEVAIVYDFHQIKTSCAIHKQLSDNKAA